MREPISACFLTRVFGVGTIVPFSRGNVGVSDPLSETNVDLKAGGVQSTGGVRLKF